MISALDHARARSQTAIVVKYLAACCEICNAIHTNELHAAVLRLREPLPPRDIFPRRSMPDKLNAFLASTIPVLCECGVTFPSLNPAVAKRCADCANRARLKGIARSNRRNAKDRKGIAA